MTIFDQIKSIFSQKQTLATPFVQENIVRTDHFLTDFAHWQTTSGSRKLIAHLSGLFHLGDDPIASQKTVVLLNTPQSVGVLWYAQNRFSSVEYEFLFDYLALQFKTVCPEYVLQNSDRKVFVDAQKTEETFRYYFKPRLRNNISEAGIVNQWYGNVILELKKVNQSVVCIKIQCNVYSDRNYTQPMDFKTLIALLLV